MASRSREYLNREEHLANMRRAKMECRGITEDVQIAGIGLRRIQIAHMPSFFDGSSWDVRQLGEDWFLYRSTIQEDTNSLIGYDRLLSDPGRLKEIFDSLCSIEMPIAPDLSGMGGCDGESFELAIYGDMFSSIRVRWWCDPRAQWQKLATTATDMIKYFNSLELDVSFT
jgi:hypothetical protein